MTTDSGEHNWAGNLRYQASSVHAPTDIEELQALVASSSRIKALGTRHSFTAIADCPEGTLVSLAGLDPAVEVDHSSMTATVPGGASYGVVAQALEAEGVALANMGSLPHISVAGGTATGTHGSGDTNQVLAGAIAALELVTADGDLRRIDRSHPDLPALAVGLGAFGIITRVTLDVEPSYPMRQDLYHDVPWEAALASFDELTAHAYSVNILTQYSPDTIDTVICKERVEIDADGHDLTGPAPTTLLGGWLDRTDERKGPQHTVRTGEPGPWCDRLPHFRLDAEPSMAGDELQTDYMVRREDATDAIRALRSMGEAIDPHLWGTEIRSVAADELWMSPARGQDSVSIGFTWRKHPTEVGALLPVIEEALAPYEPRPHWGKLFALTPDVLRRRNPRFDDFLDLADAYDPDGKLSNPFLRGLR